MGNWNFDEIENSLVSDAEKRITRGYTRDVRGLNPGSPQTSEDVAARDLSPDILRQAEKSEKPTDGDARGQTPDSEPVRVQSPGIERPQERPLDDIIGVKCSETKGVQTYLPLADYMRLLQQKTLRKQNIAQVAGVAIIDWLDRQEQKNA